jgi:hypothetical protein
MIKFDDHDTKLSILVTNLIFVNNSESLTFA